MSHAHIHAHTLTPDHSLNLTFTLRTHSLARSLAQSPKYKYMPNIDVQLGTTRVRKLIKNKICFRLDPKWERSISITKFVGEKFVWQVLYSNLLGIHLNSSDQCIIWLTSAVFNKVTFARSTLFFFSWNYLALIKVATEVRNVLPFDAKENNSKRKKKTQIRFYIIVIIIICICRGEFYVFKCQPFNNSAFQKSFCFAFSRCNSIIALTDRSVII